MPAHPPLAVTAVLAAVCLQSGCAPALDWREVQPAGTRLQALLPCRPTAHERTIPLAGQAVRLALQACSAGGLTWGLASADVRDPARVNPALAELGTSASGNIGAASVRTTPAEVPGATPNDGNQRVWMRGVLPDGKSVVMQVLVFAHGTRVFQATVLGEQLPGESADTFFQSLRFRP